MKPITHTLFYKSKIIFVDYLKIEQTINNNDFISIVPRYEIHNIYDSNWIDIYDNFDVKEILNLENILKECLEN